MFRHWVCRGVNGEHPLAANEPGLATPFFVILISWTVGRHAVASISFGDNEDWRKVGNFTLFLVCNTGKF